MQPSVFAESSSLPRCIVEWIAADSLMWLVPGGSSTCLYNAVAVQKDLTDKQKRLLMQALAGLRPMNWIHHFQEFVSFPDARPYRPCSEHEC